METHKGLIFLTGFMSSGKTTVGKQLSKKLKKTFIDLDELIESKENRQIKDIFEKNGESYFRTLESFYLQSIKSKNAVVALGGGTLLSKTNQNCVKSLGLLVNLNVNYDIFKKRMQESRELQKRPIKVVDEKSFLDFFEKRSAGYKRANLVIDTNSKTVSDIVKEISLYLLATHPKKVKLQKPVLKAKRSKVVMFASLEGHKS